MRFSQWRCYIYKEEGEGPGDCVVVRTSTQHILWSGTSSSPDYIHVWPWSPLSTISRPLELLDFHKGGSG